MTDRIVTLNMGLGRDSITMLCLLIEGKLLLDGEPIQISDVDAVVFSDLEAEWAHTYAVLPLVERLCREHGLRFVVLRKPKAEGANGWRWFLASKRFAKEGGLPFSEDGTPNWARDPDRYETIEARAAAGGFHLRPPILEDYKSRETVVSLGKGDCTDNHKIGPIRRFLEALSIERFGVGNREWGADVRRGDRRPHVTLIGIAADEASRAVGSGNGPSYVEEAYPLIEMGISKSDEAAILSRWGLGHVRKSGCFMCPYQPVGWYWAVRETDPEAWERVLEYERVALARNKNMSVKGKRPLTELVSEWRAANPDATVDAVLDKSYARCGGAKKGA